jgi:beta-glucosidase
MASVGSVKSPASDSPEDIETARRAMFSVKNRDDLWSNGLWLDPIYLGHYPEDGLKIWGDNMPKILPGDMETINQPLDYFAANIYNGETLKTAEDGSAELVPMKTGGALTAFKWPVTPECMYWGPKFYYDRYKLPEVITENGMSGTDWVSLDGKVHDPQRIDFLNRYLLQFEKAGEDGTDIRGYFQWSIMDNFEWAEGYKERFGIVHVDYTTQERTLKDSARWYSEVIKSNGKALHGKR